MIYDAIKLAFRHLSQEEFAARQLLILNLMNAGTIEQDGFFIGVDNNTIVGVLISHLRPDGLVMIWSPTTSGDFSFQPFFTPLDNYARSRNAPAIILMIDKNQSIDEKIILENGFEYISDMLMLVSDASEESKNVKAYFPQDKQTNLGENSNAISLKDLSQNESEFSLRFVPLSEDTETNANNELNSQKRLEKLMIDTYVNTNDFPKLLALSPTKRILDEYRRNDLFRPELWFFVQKLCKSADNENKDVGVLLLTDSPPNQIELTYMGLIESERGCGYSREIIKFAKKTALVYGRKLVTTTVDEQNAPALRSYIKQNFVAWDRKKIYAKFL
jgi:GNAT superfamily N-acetyltransferase